MQTRYTVNFKVLKNQYLEIVLLFLVMPFVCNLGKKLEGKCWCKHGFILEYYFSLPDRNV